MYVYNSLSLASHIKGISSPKKTTKKNNVSYYCHINLPSYCFKPVRFYIFLLLQITVFICTMKANGAQNKTFTVKNKNTFHMNSWNLKCKWIHMKHAFILACLDWVGLKEKTSVKCCMTDFLLQSTVFLSIQWKSMGSKTLLDPTDFHCMAKICL